MDWTDDNRCRWRASVEPAGPNAARHAGGTRGIFQNDGRTKHRQIGGYRPRHLDRGSIGNRAATIFGVG